MSGSAGRPRWLRKAGGEWEWAYSYMQQATEKGIRTRIRYATWGKDPCYEMVADSIAYLQETSDGLEFVTRLRNALRQRRYRSESADKKRKPYTFTLPIDTKKTLSIHAERLKTTEKALLADLLNGSEKLLKEHREREQILQDALKHERKHRIQLDERWKVKHGEAIRQIERLSTLLTMWELTLGQADPGFDGDEATLQSESKKKIGGIKKAINDAIKMHELLEARLI
ncbi:hypothetical protein ACM7LY_23085 [Pseudomonas aeruginosa]|nr:hypothetical protein [Pseudomonas aeruginosa]